MAKKKRGIKIINLFAVCMAGVLGVGMRYVVGILFSASHFAIPTFIVHALGCFIFGMGVTFANQLDVSHWVRVAILVGLCGGLTTFSSFAYDIIRFISNQQIGAAAMYFFATHIVCLLCFSIGYFIATLFK